MYMYTPVNAAFPCLKWGCSLQGTNNVMCAQQSRVNTVLRLRGNTWLKFGVKVGLHRRCSSFEFIFGSIMFSSLCILFFVHCASESKLFRVTHLQSNLLARKSYQQSGDGAPLKSVHMKE